MSFEVILPFLRPIEHLILDQEISEIMVNGPARVFIERHGAVEEVPGVSMPERSLQVAVRNIARALGDEISEEKPLLDSRLPDGSRVAAVIPPCSVGGTTLTIRKFQSRLFTARELVRIGSMTEPVLAVLQTSVERAREHPDLRRYRDRQDQPSERSGTLHRATMTASSSSRTPRRSRSTSGIWFVSRPAASSRI